jgi:hypothetical protein
MRIEAVTPIQRDSLPAIDRPILVGSQVAVSARLGSLTYEVLAVRQPYVKAYPLPTHRAACPTAVTYVVREGGSILGRIDVSRSPRIPVASYRTLTQALRLIMQVHKVHHALTFAQAALGTTPSDSVMRHSLI